MVGDPAAVGARGGDYQPATYGSGRPTAARRDLGRQPALPVERPDELVHVDDGGLELDHRDRARCGVPGQEVDDSALAVDGEGNLGNHDPAGPACDPISDVFAQCRMSGVDDAVELAAG